jgi:transposase
VSSKRQRKVYSQEFKTEAVELANSKGFAQAGEDLGVHPTTIRGWAKKLQKGPQNASNKSNAKTYEELEKENKKLKRELQYMEEINRVLKKSTAIFSLDQLKNSK